MQLSWFALSTHKQEIPKNFNEIQHKRQQNTVANYIYTRVSNTRPGGILCWNGTVRRRRFSDEMLNMFSFEMSPKCESSHCCHLGSV